MTAEPRALAGQSPAATLAAPPARSGGWSPALVRLVHYWRHAGPAACLFVALLVTTAVLDHRLVLSGEVVGLLAGAAPLVLAALAETPPILAGGGGIDLSVGPLMGLVNAIVAGSLVGASATHRSPALILGAALAVGVGSGLLNGLLVVVLRLQPIVVTLGTYLVYTGLALQILPQPGGGAPGWLTRFAGAYHGFPMPLVGVAVLAGGWIVFTRLPAYEQLIATGSNDRAAFVSGVRVGAVRVTAYVLAGVGAALAGLALTALLAAGNPTVGPGYTLSAVAAVALGGVSLAGGRGGMAGALFGALNVFLIQTVLTHFNASPYLIEMIYGLVLVGAVVLNALSERTKTA